jgi:hypothetical protein
MVKRNVMKMRGKKSGLLNANGIVCMILSATVLLLCTACFWLQVKSVFSNQETITILKI